MKQFKFDKQLSIELYRKWYILEKRDRNNYFDKDQITDLYNLIYIQTKHIINYYCGDDLILVNDEYEIHQDKPFFRCDFPLLYIDYNNFKKVIIEILVIGNSIECLNLPGCIVEGKNLNEAFEKFIIAAIECFDVRFRNQMYLTNRVYPMKTYWDFPEISSIDYIQELINDGWDNIFHCHYNTILLNNISTVTYTIPKNNTISGNLRFAFKRYQFLVDYHTFRLMNL
jgi:hypothetical protein